MITLVVFIQGFGWWNSINVKFPLFAKPQMAYMNLQRSHITFSKILYHLQGVCIFVDVPRF
jgi:hypothetical protein